MEEGEFHSDFEPESCMQKISSLKNGEGTAMNDFKVVGKRNILKNNIPVINLYQDLY